MVFNKTEYNRLQRRYTALTIVCGVVCVATIVVASVICVTLFAAWWGV